MEQYISKSVLIAELEKRKHQNLLNEGAFEEDIDILSLLDTLEIKEMGLEKELIEWHKEHFKKDGTLIGMSGFYLTNSSQMDIAKHFFELGLNASNPLTWEDMMLIHKCCKDAMNSNLYVWQTAEGQQKIYEDVLKQFKAQKGEKV